VWPEVERVLKPGGTAAFWASLEMLIETTLSDFFRLRMPHVLGTLRYLHHASW